MTDNPGLELVTLTVNHTPVHAMGDYLFPQPMAEAMGLDWEAQRKRIRRSAWSKGWTSMVEVQVPGDIQARERFALHHTRVPMWIATIDASRVSPLARPTVEAWQCEIADVLAEHYFPSQPAPVVSYASRFPNSAFKAAATMKQVEALKARGYTLVSYDEVDGVYFLELPAPLVNADADRVERVIEELLRRHRVAQAENENDYGTGPRRVSAIEKLGLGDKQ